MILFANIGSVITGVLAVLGGAVLGGWFAGWALGSIQHHYFKDQKIPGYAFWAVRSLSFLFFGLLTFLLLYGTLPGWGFGGGGPVADGGGKDTPVKEGKKPPPKEGTKETPGKVGTGTMRIEVLGDEPLVKINKGGTLDQNKRYRVARGEAPMTFEALQKVVRSRREGKDGLKKVEIVLYTDSPIAGLPQVADLRAWLRDLGADLSVDLSQPDSKAPVD